MTTSIHPDTKLGYVHLTVSNLERAVSYYQQALGFQLHRRQNGEVYLGAGRDDLLCLSENPQARQVSGVSGLYHFAILTPSRLALARSLHHLIETKTPIGGFSDHLVSEAIYLSDPDGNGIEIYRDRPRSEWQYPDNRLKMAVDPLDIDGLLAELDGQAEAWAGLPPDTTIGHVHLHVSQLTQAETFYQQVIGFDLMVRYGGQASFLSAGGYHHHLGINTWAGVGAPTPPPDAVGLRWFTVRLPDEEALQQVVNRAQAAGVAVTSQAEGLFLQDPAQNGVMLTVD